MFPKRIVAIGASTCEGGVDIEGGGFMGRLRRWMEAKDQHNHVYNLGISGDTTTGILARMTSEMKPRKPDFIIIATGSNDSIRIGSRDGEPKTVLVDFKRNIKTLLDQAQGLASGTLVVGMHPIDDSKTTPIPWKTDHFFVLEAVEQHVAATKKICQQKGINYLDIWAEWVKEDYSKYLHTDGLHPNSAGHQKTFEMIRDYLTSKFQ